MLRFLKKFAWAGLLAGTVQGAFGFSLLGQFDTWQVTQLSYDRGFTGFNEGPATVGDAPIGGPMNLGEEFRWNIPVLYYSYDQSFLDYFGSNGVFAIDQAMAILNGVTNVSSYSAELSEVPLEATRINFRAQALGLLDLKSAALHIMVEKLGLADPVRYTWCLRARVLPPGAMCPAYDYLVIKRNFDPVTFEPSSYVNGTLYTYRIVEFCPVLDFAEAFEHRVDPAQTFYTAVASPGQSDGSFYTGLTRDDVGGLRYLLNTNNVNLEDSGPGTLTLVTNNSAQLLTTSNLALFAQQALTNDQATLQGLYPNLVILSVTNTFTNIAITNLSAFFTNFPYDPAGTPAHLAFATNITYSVLTLFHYTFANLFTFKFTTNGWIAVLTPDISFSTNRAFTTVQTIAVTNSPYSPAGSPPVTNTFMKTSLTNLVSGDFFITPTNLCEIAIIAPQLTNVITSTNLIGFSSNIFNAININGQSFTQNRIDYFTNHTFVIYPIICLSSNLSMNQGIERMTFIRRDFDSLVGQFFLPITNEYVLNSFTNSRIVPLLVRRVVTAPDILFSADDLVSDPTTFPILVHTYARTNFYNDTHRLPGLPGPGVLEPIQPFQTVIFNKVGPSFANAGPFFIDEPSNFPFFVWGSFDGTTNAPIIYPSGTSIMDYENEILLQVTTSSLTNGSVGSSYNARLQGSGGVTPYTWSLAPSSGPLPPGLGEFSAACNCWVVPANGTISGTPTTAGTYFFTVVMTDANNVSVTRDLSITITP